MRYKIPQTYSDEQIIKTFDNIDNVYKGLTISKVAKEVGCHTDTAKTRLGNLVSKGILKSTKIGMNIVYWKE